MTERTMDERDDEREDGFYWVRTHGGWEIAKWWNDDQDWLMISDDDPHRSGFFLQIDERRIVRPAE